MKTLQNNQKNKKPVIRLQNFISLVLLCIIVIFTINYTREYLKEPDTSLLVNYTKAVLTEDEKKENEIKLNDKEKELLKKEVKLAGSVYTTQSDKNKELDFTIFDKNKKLSDPNKKINGLNVYGYRWIDSRLDKGQNFIPKKQSFYYSTDKNNQNVIVYYVEQNLLSHISKVDHIVLKK